MYVRRVLSVFIALFCLQSVASADVAGTMDSYYEGSKSYVSSTQAGAYQTQSRRAYTGGNYVWRAPQVTEQLVSVQLPSIKAGCGGIDMFVGGFSFINGEQLEQLLRAILQDAAGYAFKLALDTISPKISGVVSEMQTMVQQINSLNVNSCEAASALVDTIGGGQEAVEEKLCQVNGAIEGFFDDSFAGRSCGDTKPGDVAGKATKNDPDLQNSLATNQNYAMNATSRSSIKDDLELREFYMSLTGTIVVTLDEKTEIQYLAPISLDESVVRILMSGGTLKGHKCKPTTFGGRSYSALDCLSVDQGLGEIDISADDAFLKRVEEALNSIYDKAANETGPALTEQEIAFVNDTPLPIYNAALDLHMAYPEIGKTILLSYAELIAYEMTLKFMERSSRSVLDGSQTITNADAQAMEAWRKGVTDNIIELGRQQSRLQERFSNVQHFIDSMKSIEATVTADMNSQLLRSINKTSQAQ